MPSGKLVAAASNPKTHCGGAAASQQTPPPRTAFAPRKKHQTDTLIVVYAVKRTLFTLDYNLHTKGAQITRDPLVRGDP